MEGKETHQNVVASIQVRSETFETWMKNVFNEDRICKINVNGRHILQSVPQ